MTFYDVAYLFGFALAQLMFVGVFLTVCFLALRNAFRVAFRGKK